MSEKALKSVSVCSEPPMQQAVAGLEKAGK